MGGAGHGRRAAAASCIESFIFKGLIYSTDETHTRPYKTLTKLPLPLHPEPSDRLWVLYDKAVSVSVSHGAPVDMSTVLVCDVAP